MQAFLERASVVADRNRREDLFRHKVGAAVTAARRGGALNTLDTMNHFFMLQNMFVVGSSYWAMITTGKRSEKLFQQNGKTRYSLSWV